MKCTLTHLMPWWCNAIRKRLRTCKLNAIKIEMKAKCCSLFCLNFIEFLPVNFQWIYNINVLNLKKKKYLCISSPIAKHAKQITKNTYHKQRICIWLHLNIQRSKNIKAKIFRLYVATVHTNCSPPFNSIRSLHFFFVFIFLEN